MLRRPIEITVKNGRSSEEAGWLLGAMSRRILVLDVVVLNLEKTIGLGRELQNQGWWRFAQAGFAVAPGCRYTQGVNECRCTPETMNDPR